MKIIVEEGDHWPGPPGTYEFHPTRTTTRFDDGVQLELRGQMGSQVCNYCGMARRCSPTCMREDAERGARMLAYEKQRQAAAHRMIFDDVTSPEAASWTDDQRRAAVEYYTRMRLDDKAKQLREAYGLREAKVVTMKLPDRGGIAPIPKGAVVFGNDKGEAEAFVPRHVYSEPCRYDFSNLGGNHDGFPTPEGFVPQHVKRAAMKRQGTIVELKRECGHCGTEVPTGYCDCDEARADRLDAAAAAHIKSNPDEKTEVPVVDLFDFEKLELPPDRADQLMVDVLTRNKDKLRRALDLPTQVGSLGPAPKKCDECAGTGQWENPISGKRSPCSRGCKPCP